MKTYFHERVEKTVGSRYSEHFWMTDFVKYSTVLVAFLTETFLRPFLIIEKYICYNVSHNAKCANATHSHSDFEKR
jgi:hypothetical protein